MESDKIKQYISQFGGMIALLYLALQASGIEVEFLNPDHVQPWINFLMVFIPFLIGIYGVYKNSYILRKKSREQEKVLKENNLK